MWRRIGVNALISPRFGPCENDVTEQRGNMREYLVGAVCTGAAARADAAVRCLALAGGLLRLSHP